MELEQKLNEFAFLSNLDRLSRTSRGLPKDEEMQEIEATFSTLGPALLNFLPRWIPTVDALHVSDESCRPDGRRLTRKSFLDLFPNCSSISELPPTAVIADSLDVKCYGDLSTLRHLLHSGLRHDNLRGWRALGAQLIHNTRPLSIPELTAECNLRQRQYPGQLVYLFLSPDLYSYHSRFPIDNKACPFLLEYDLFEDVITSWSGLVVAEGQVCSKIEGCYSCEAKRVPRGWTIEQRNKLIISPVFTPPPVEDVVVQRPEIKSRWDLELD